MSTQVTFQPMRLLLPSSGELERLRATCVDSERMTEVGFRLSGKPHVAWVNFFAKSWRFWYGEKNVPQVNAGTEYVFVNCLPSELPEVRQMLVEIIDEANRMSAPRIRCEAARIAAGQKRRARMEALEAKHNQPLWLSNDRDGARLADMYRKNCAREKQELTQEIAHSEIDDAIEQMVNDDLLDAMSRIEAAA